MPSDLLERDDDSPIVSAEDGEWMHIGITAEERRQIPVADQADLHVFYAALMAQEDRRFFEHAGVDVQGLARAASATVFGGRRQGASTITMQLARMMDRMPRTFIGKVHQVFRARQIERRHSKREILHAYAARVPVGGNLHGVASAAYAWFGKRAEDLDAAEAALIVSVLPAPSRYSPKRDPNGALLRRNRVLDAMHAQSLISDNDHRQATEASLGLDPLAFPDLGAHTWQRVSEGTTTIDAAMQRRVEEIAKRQQGVDGLSIVVVENRDACVRALVGSKNGSPQELDATTRPRSAGSTLKPFLYALAYDQGHMVPSTVLWDMPWQRPDWNPSNFDKLERGPVPAHEALWASYNLPAVRVAEALPAGAFADCLRQLGFRRTRSAQDRARVDLALGTDDVTALELAGAYASLARGGDVLEPTFQPRRGDDTSSRVFSEGAARLVLASLSDPQRPRPAGAPRRGVAWKTGTSSKRRDAWSVGVTAKYTVVAWRGRLSGSPDASLVGARIATPLMFEVLASIEPSPASLDVATGTRSVEVCALTGLRCTKSCEHRRTSSRPAGAAPLQACQAHRRITVDASTGCERCRHCKGAHVVVDADVALMSPRQLHWLRRMGQAPKPYPVHADDCQQVVDEPMLRPEFLSPMDGQTFVAEGATYALRIHVVGPDADSQIRLLAGTRDLGKTNKDGRITVRLAPGTHTLTAITSRRTEHAVVIHIEPSPTSAR